MDVLVVTLFVSLMLVIAGLVLFILRMRAGDFEHGDRLSLLPLEDDDGMKDVDLESNDDKFVQKSSNAEDSGPDCDE